MKKWYHEKKENAKRKYLQGYYPKHFRTPNLIVCWLYEAGYFFGDFVPLLLNLIEGIYSTIKKLIGFVVGLLVDSMIFIVLAGSVVFSVFHSIQRLQIAGATNGLEYVGVLMFEVIFMSSSAMLTGFLMKKKLPKSFIEWVGLILTSLGFLVGLVFVWWSNVNGMAPTTEGFIIGSAVPLLVLIGQGIIAYRYFIENQKTVENNTKNGEETNHEKVPEMVLEKVKKDAENGTKINRQMVRKTVEHDTKNKLKNGTEIESGMVPVVTEKPVTKNGTETNRNVAEKTVENDTGKDSGKPEKSTAEEIQEVPERVPESSEKTITEMVEKDTKYEDESKQNTNQKSVEKTTENTTKIDTETNTKTDAKNGTEIKRENGTKKSTKRTKNLDPDAKKIKRAAKRWAKKYFKENGKLPGRVRIQKNVEKCNQSIARDVVEELKKEIRAS